MRVKLALSAAVASLLFAAPVLAEEAAAPEGKDASVRPEHRHGKKGWKMGRKKARMEHRLERAVAEGRLTQAQADAFAAEARQLREEVRSMREASNGQLSDAQRDELRARKRAFHEKVRAALQASKS